MYFSIEPNQYYCIYILLAVVGRQKLETVISLWFRH